MNASRTVLSVVIMVYAPTRTAALTVLVSIVTREMKAVTLALVKTNIYSPYTASYLVLCTVTFCSDINECVMNTTVCPENATCENTPGGYECQCPEGYTHNITENLCEGKINCQHL